MKSSGKIKNARDFELEKLRLKAIIIRNEIYVKSCIIEKKSEIKRYLVKEGFKWLVKKVRSN